LLLRFDGTQSALMTILVDGNVYLGSSAKPEYVLLPYGQVPTGGP
jgi:hypothetical protein